MLLTGSSLVDADRAFARASRARRRARALRAVRRRCRDRGRLPVLPEAAGTVIRPMPVAGVREIPLDAIAGTLDPGRSRMFDGAFRPAAEARDRWQRVWLAEHRGVLLPPISVVRVGDAYAVRDGHHRVSVARARGGLTIDATVDGVAGA